MRILHILTALLLTLSFTAHATAQASCTVVNVTFDCPPAKYFREIKVEEKETRIFKYLSRGSALYIFMSVPTDKFDPNSVAQPAYSSDAKVGDGQFEWAVESKPILMDFETKYKPNVAAWLGLRKALLIEVKAFQFKVGSRGFVLGYMADWSEGQSLNSRRFKAAQPIGDNAEGCNMVMTLLNSVTKEFPEKDQGCTLSVPL
jgi:hypothetical protein